MSKPTDQQNTAPVVWLLTDNKPGHRNQLKGLGNRLRVIAGASLYWVDAGQVKVSVWRALLAMAPNVDQALPKPDLVVAAGTGTHRLLLSLRRLRKVKTLVLMKPGFPLGWVSAGIVPVHDGVNASSRVLLTDGVINTVTPLARITDKPEALILIGGPSHHFDWDSDVLLGQVNHLIGHYPTWRWTISGSRRTPDELLSRLQELAGPKITVVAPAETHENWLSHQLAASRAVWVSPDSMSMVCEAATSGVPTGLFQFTPHPGSRVAEGVNRLVQEGRVARWSDHAAVMAGKTMHHEPLWEADRAARWVIARNLLPASKKTESGNGRKIA
ncbi:ELM1/GtrOC1 family putative glycosyltransferase [Marinobacter sp. M216]|uniref:ELM1/GtrOC1 family putative glycosyltransferase n=1 Tax=Marinobacter albus TaxID=3030833 RepID=A0ABT7HGU2_9GAMM|nr:MULTISPECIES: ELM1/GtrOC1 family putative glycosyltransferase [unclassified Marinobacter]MBW7473029.1 mitochondrial fission ELM1 family protein [Marinobacter sp. F4218]MDK9559578.1 ELM1/GtrOC1 family putative glycosyltransferase [Marinobacter sp. M216]